MDSLHQPSKPVYYEYRVRGRLTSHGAPWFEGMDIAVDEAATPVQTIIQGEFADQAALHGMINCIRDLGLTLL